MKFIALLLLIAVSAFAETVVRESDIAKLRANLVKQRDVLYLQGSQLNSPAMTKCAEQLDETIRKLDALPRVDVKTTPAQTSTPVPVLLPVLVVLR